MNKEKLIEFYNAMQALLIHNVAFEDLYFNFLKEADYKRIFLFDSFSFNIMKEYFNLSHVEYEYVFSEKWESKGKGNPENMLARLATLIDSGVPAFWDVTSCDVRVKTSTVNIF